MGNLVLFTPKVELDALKNLLDFVALCRDKLTVFGENLSFDEDIWDITESLGLKAKGEKRERLIFSTQEAVSSGTAEMMRDFFRPYAKAYMRYQHAMRPTKSVGSRMAALRVLEAALIERGENAHVAQADLAVFNRAAQIAKDHFSAGVAFRVGGQLELIASFLTDNRLSTVPVRWRNFVKRPSDNNLIGEEADKRRDAKMPSREVLEAIPKAFRLAVEPSDVMVTSIVALLLSAPDRINEVLLLSTNCEVSQSQGEGKPDAYGLRWRPAKGAEPMIKLIVSTMADVVRDALARIRICTEEARAIARWYEKNPNKIYLSEDLEYLRATEFLTMEDVGHILWVKNGEDKGQAKLWCKGKNIVTVKEKDGRKQLARFSDIESAVIAMLPAGFPFLNKEIGLKYSEALLINQKNAFHANRVTYRCVIEAVTVDKVNERLGTGSQHGKKSIFERLGLVSADGSPLEVTTHLFRHYLNTIAQAGSMSDIDIAKWSGRKDVNQNAAYDHTSSSQRVANLREALGDSSKMVGPLSEIPKYIPIRRDEFAQLVIPTAHTTDFGMCIHDYSMIVCQVHTDCINCHEQVCVKGDKKKMEWARKKLDEAELLAARAKKDLSEGIFVAERWYDHHMLTLERLRQLNQIYDNPDIADGAFIQLSIPEMPSRLQQAADARSLLENNPSASIPSVVSLGVLPGLLNSEKGQS